MTGAWLVLLVGIAGAEEPGRERTPVHYRVGAGAAVIAQPEGLGPARGAGLDVLASPWVVAGLDAGGDDVRVALEVQSAPLARYRFASDRTYAPWLVVGLGLDVGGERVRGAVLAYAGVVAFGMGVRVRGELVRVPDGWLGLEVRGGWAAPNAFSGGAALTMSFDRVVPPPARVHVVGRLAVGGVVGRTWSGPVWGSGRWEWRASPLFLAGLDVGGRMVRATVEVLTEPTYQYLIDGSDLVHARLAVGCLGVEAGGNRVRTGVFGCGGFVSLGAGVRSRVALAHTRVGTHGVEARGTWLVSSNYQAGLAYVVTFEKVDRRWP